MSDASPRFRQDLATSPVEADGVPCVDVRDPKTGASFRLYDFEYQLALQLNGQPVANVVDWASQAYGAELTFEGVNEFAARLRELGFLEIDGAAAPAGSDAAATLEVKVPKLPAVEEPAENAADEWMTAQSAQTAQFVPDASMLGPPELTPVAPLSLSLTEGAKTVERTVPIDAAAPAEVSGGDATVPVSLDDLDGPPPRKTPAAWAVELDGNVKPADQAAAGTSAAEVTKEVTLPPLPPAAPVETPPPPKIAPPPPGVTERRQPPTPEAVVMSGFSEDAKEDGPVARRSRAPVIAIVLVVVAAAAVGGFLYWKSQHPAAAPQAIRVHVLTPAPAAVYRWFDRPGQVTSAETLALSFPNGGRLTELLPSGTEVSAGEIVGKLQAAAPVEAALEHHRSRVGFYKQVRDAMRAAGNEAAAHHAEVMLAEKERLADEARATLARYIVVASEPGEIVETLAKVGAAVAPGAPVARVKSRLLRGTFPLDAADRDAFSRADFCRVEVIGLAPRASNEPPRRAGPPVTAVDSSPLEAQVGPRFVDCERLGGRPAAEPVQVALPGDVGLVSGQPLRLARRRFDGVFPVPASALLGEGDQRTVWVAERDGTSASRPVVLADDGDEALVSQGLRVGDQVIVDPPAELHAGSHVAIAP